MCHGVFVCGGCQIYQDFARRGILSSTGILLRNVLAWGLLSLLGVTPGVEALTPENVASPTLLLPSCLPGVSQASATPSLHALSCHTMLMYCYRGERPRPAAPAVAGGEARH